MKKLALVIALTGFIGTYSIANSLETVNTELEGDHDKKCKKKDCKKCKDSKKACTKEKTAKSKTCNKSAAGKSCCAKKK